ncbi:DUF4232 domain-containing protein [Streptomyces sp. YIM S03343]
MQYIKGIRRAVTTAAVVSAALAVTACQPGGDTTGAGTGSGSGKPSKAPGTATSAPSPSSPTSKASPAATPSPSKSKPAGTTASPVTASSGPAAAGCGVSALDVSARQAAVRPDGTGTGAAIVEFTNVSGKTCVLSGHPTVAGAGNGSPEKNRPLAVTPAGTASAVTLAPGGKAWVKLTFVQVQGEADGYCKSGATPSSYPTIVVGLPGAGKHQVALDDGVFAECDDTVTATAVSAAKPS